MNNIQEIELIYQSSYDKYEELYNYFLKYCELEVLVTDLVVGYRLIRARDISSLESIKSKKDVQFHPTSKNFSRIGKPNQIWFYLSDDENACLLEMLPSWLNKYKLGQTIDVVLTLWQIREKMKVIIIPDFYKKNEIVNKLNLNSSFNNKEFWYYICKKFKTTTLEDKNIYYFTSAFSNALIDRYEIEKNTIDGIFFPSVQYPEKSNLAFKPHLVKDEHLILSDLKKISYRKSLILNKYGKPQYFPIDGDIQGYYEPNLDKITWI